MQILEELLNTNLNYLPTYGKWKLSNHLSMALIALQKMGARDEQLIKFSSYYSKKLTPVADNDKKIFLINLNNWESYLGRQDSYLIFVKFFQDNINLNGIDETLKQFLPTLVKGLASQAFHCLIRLAYSVEIYNPKEVAAALAYFASEYIVLAELRPDVYFSSVPPEKILFTIRENSTLCGKKYDNPTITDRLLMVIKQPDFAAINEEISNSNFILDECVATAASIYSATSDFTALHMITAGHALKILLPFLNNQSLAIRYYWQGVCAAYISIGSPEFDNITLVDEGKNWSEILSVANNSLDDHLVKLVYTCYSYSKFSQSGIYKKIAEKLC